MIRLRIRVRTTEGDYGDVRLTVVAKTSPRKSAQVHPYGICARFWFPRLLTRGRVLSNLGKRGRTEGMQWMRNIERFGISGLAYAVTDRDMNTRS